MGKKRKVLSARAKYRNKHSYLFKQKEELSPVTIEVKETVPEPVMIETKEPIPEVKKKPAPKRRPAKKPAAKKATRKRTTTRKTSTTAKK